MPQHRPVEVLGVPSSIGVREETSFVVDQQHGPANIRQAYNETMHGFDIVRPFSDLGDVQIKEAVGETLTSIAERVGAILASGTVPIVLGGAHTLTLGSLRALHANLQDYSLIYFDAHPDLMPHHEINYGSSLYYAIKEGLVRPEQIALLGIRQIEREEAAFIKAQQIFSVTPIEFEHRGARAICDDLLQRFKPPYVLSIDLDSIELAECPGVTTPFPGGLHFREVLYIARRCALVDCRYADIVELAPANDRNHESARLGAILLHTLSDMISGASLNAL